MTPQHLRDIVDVAERHKIPIIADEVSTTCLLPAELALMYSCHRSMDICTGPSGHLSLWHHWPSLRQS